MTGQQDNAIGSDTIAFRMEIQQGSTSIRTNTIQEAVP
jgi:hypothetical protein